MIYIRNNDWRSDYRDAGALILPMAGRYTYFLDRNKQEGQLFSAIPPNLLWLLNQYVGKFTTIECVNAIGRLNHLTNTYALEKNVTTVLQSTCCNMDIKPDASFLKSFTHKPSVISLNVAANAFGFDSKPYNNDHTELICEDSKKIESAIIRAVTMAINAAPKDNNNIYITPLFKNGMYLPTDDSKINPKWNHDNYINSLLMLLSKYNLDRYNIHIFVRTVVGADKC